jgi:pimeloyl-ACP methyl ester carboxylesterase
MMQKFDEDKLILIHGLEGSSQGDKAVLLRSKFPRMLTPDFRGPLDDRMGTLCALLGEDQGWTVIGSSLGGLMAALFCVDHPEQVRRLILLAPALFLPEFSRKCWETIDVPSVVYQGSQDVVVPVAQTRVLSERTFSSLQFFLVDDDHRLFNTTQNLDWDDLVGR